MSTPRIRSYADARAYLAGGRAKDVYRPVAGNTYLARVDDHAIALVFHQTAVVTYRDNGTQVLFTGGWFTATTKDRIKSFSACPAHLSNHNGSRDGSAEGWVIGSIGTTEPKRQKCRARGSKWFHARGCQGTGQMIEYVTCHGPAVDHDETFRDRNRCPGPTKCSGARYDWPRRDDGTRDYDAGMRREACDHGRTEAHEVEPCPHGRESSHSIVPCEHGRESSHKTGTREVECWQCYGTGVQDYGSKSIPLVWSAGTVTISDAGELVSENGTEHPYCPPRHSAVTYKPKPAPVSSASADVMGAEVADRLAALLPGMNESARCPQCGQASRVRHVIVHLNDAHHATREVIADWLETLDADLTFPTTV